MYRGITQYMLMHDIFPEQTQEIIQALQNCDFRMKLTHNDTHIHMDGQDLTPYLRSMQVNNCVADYAAIPEVRDYLREKQKAIGNKGAVVMDGRDIGTHILPHAELKVFMIGDEYVRAKRRQKQLQEKKGTFVSLEDIVQNIRERDYKDYLGPHATSRKASDARILDTTTLTLDEQIATVVQRARTEIKTS